MHVFIKNIESNHSNWFVLGFVSAEKPNMLSAKVIYQNQQDEQKVRDKVKHTKINTRNYHIKLPVFALHKMLYCIYRCWSRSDRIDWIILVSIYTAGEKNSSNLTWIPWTCIRASQKSCIWFMGKTGYCKWPTATTAWMVQHPLWNNLKSSHCLATFIFSLYVKGFILAIAIGTGWQRKWDREL